MKERKPGAIEVRIVEESVRKTQQMHNGEEIREKVDDTWLQ